MSIERGLDALTELGKGSDGVPGETGGDRVE